METPPFPQSEPQDPSTVFELYSDRQLQMQKALDMAWANVEHESSQGKLSPQTANNLGRMMATDIEFRDTHPELYREI